MEIKETIDQLLTKRSEFKQEIEADKITIEGYKSNLSTVLPFESCIDTMEVGNKKEKFISLFERARKLQTEISKALTPDGAIDRMQKRAKRDYLNIGIAAPWRHGKSTFLSKIFNLGDNVSKYLIPTSAANNEACTGTTVHYINDETCHAEIKYFTEEDIIVSIKALVKGLNNNTYSDIIKIAEGYSGNLDDLISQIKAAESYGKMQSNVVTIEATLKEYVDGYTDKHYKSIMNSSKPNHTIEFNTAGTDEEALKDIFKHITFYESPTNMGTHNSFLCLAVKEVEIYMPLNYKNNEGQNVDLGKIRFVDTPGLGEKRTNVEVNLKKVLQSDIDIVIGICLTSRAKAEDFNNFNKYLCDDFNVKYEQTIKDANGIEKIVTKDARDSIFYIINCDSSQEDIKYRIYEAKMQCVIDSLKQTTYKNPIELSPNHIKYFSLKTENVYNIDENTTIITGEDGTKGYEVTPSQEEGATINFLVGCLNSINDITEIDKYFTHEAQKIIDDIKINILELRKNIEALRLEHVDLGTENDKMLNELVLELGNVEIDYQEDNSVEAMEKQLNLGCPRFVSNFIESKLKKGGEEWSTQTPTMTIENVIEKYKTANELLSQNQYDFREEFKIYYFHKDCFREYIKEKVAGYLNKKELVGSQIKFGKDVIKKFMEKFSNLNIEYSDQEPETSFVEGFERFTQEKKYGKELVTLFKELLNPQSFDILLEDYLIKKIYPSFHHEKILGESGTLLIGTPEHTRISFIHWLNDIMESISKVLHGDQSGADSFGELVDGIKKAYKEKVVAKLIHLGEYNPQNNLRKDLIGFISSNGNVLHGVKEKNDRIDHWNEIVL